MSERTPIVIVGTGGHARVVSSVLQEIGSPWRPVGAVDVVSPRLDERIVGVSVIGGLESLPDLRADGVGAAIVAIGASTERFRYTELVREMGFDLPPIVSERAYVAPSAQLGAGCLVSPLAHVGPEAVVGAGAIVNTGASLEHESSFGDFSHLAPSASVAGRARVGSHVFIGMGGRIIEQTSVADRSVIGANAVIIDDVSEPGGRHLGVPAVER